VGILFFNVFIGMNMLIKNKRLISSFDKIMKPYENLYRVDKSYDIFVHEKNRYVDLDTYNFYEDIGEDWENDNWSLQYHPINNYLTKINEYPALYYGEEHFMFMTSVMGDTLFEQLLKPWFEKTYKLPVNLVEKERC
jgi:hypothetical protein